jgi:hypothetical protein
MRRKTNQHWYSAASTDSGQAMRKRAEDMAEEQAAQIPENVAALSPEEVRQILHELRVHQIQIEMQNEELRRIQAELEASRVRYFDLYDLAPVGYCTRSEKGLIDAFVGKPFDHDEIVGVIIRFARR